MPNNIRTHLGNQDNKKISIMTMISQRNPYNAVIKIIIVLEYIDQKDSLYILVKVQIVIISLKIPANQLKNISSQIRRPGISREDRRNPKTKKAIYSSKIIKTTVI